MNRAKPTNTKRFISGEVRGMRRLHTKPAMNAPSSPSSPQSEASAALSDIVPSTKTNCTTLSLKRRRNHRATLGYTMSSAVAYTAHLVANHSQCAQPARGLSEPTATASMSSAANMATAVETTETTTDGCRPMP